MAMGEWRRRESGARVSRRVVRTAPGVDGGPKEYGNAHEMDCGSNGVMTRFRSSLTRRAGRCTHVTRRDGGERSGERGGREAAAREGDAARTEWVAIDGKKRDVGSGSTRRGLWESIREEVGASSVEQ